MNRTRNTGLAIAVAIAAGHEGIGQRAVGLGVGSALHRDQNAHGGKPTGGGRCRWAAKFAGHQPPTSGGLPPLAILTRFRLTART